MYNVMLVDDDYPVTQLLSEAIPWEGLGLRLMGSYENGWSAWEQAQREMPDILITDIGMPRMDGLELSARIRGCLRMCGSPFCPATANSNTPSRRCG